jgi:hypothetical protein
MGNQEAHCDSTFLYLFERVELDVSADNEVGRPRGFMRGIEELIGLLREWMMAQIADQNKNFDQLICDGKTLRSSARWPRWTHGICHTSHALRA